jgi:hypothetical protein
MVQVDIEARLVAFRSERELAASRAERRGLRAWRADRKSADCRPGPRLLPFFRARPADC